jgi:glycosyltransferase involved in cell wall biosynthesis
VPVRADRPLTVLQSFPDPRPTTNPYVVMLAQSLAALPELRLRTFTWRRALLGRYDVFHVHWPEILVSGRSPARKAVRQLLFAVLLARLTLARIPLVRTVHNLELPRDISRREVALLRLADRLTALRITLNDETPVPADRPAVEIVHGHYRTWFAAYPEPASRPGRLAFVGLVRRYKGVEGLVEAFVGTRDRAPDVSLLVAGRPSTDALAGALADLAGGDPRITLRLRFLSDAELVESIGEADVVVLPYREMHNSGTVLAALSLDRPVLVPDNAVNRRLAAEVGTGWVHTFAGELTGERLLRALADARARPPGRPDLSAREWDRTGRDHLAAYRRALSSRGRTYSR